MSDVIETLQEEIRSNSLQMDQLSSELASKTEAVDKLLCELADTGLEWQLVTRTTQSLTQTFRFSVRGVGATLPQP